MTWVLAKMCQLFALGMNLRNSLKILKSMSSSSSSSSSSRKEIVSSGQSFLMFWSIFALIIIWEQYFERIVAWFPLYFYAKSLFILLMAFPRLKFTHNIFYSYLIPLFEWIHNHYEHLSEVDWREFCLLLPLHLFFLFFPFHLKVHPPPDMSMAGEEQEEEEGQGGEEEGEDEYLMRVFEEESFDLSIPLDDETLDDLVLPVTPTLSAPAPAPTTSPPKRRDQHQQSFDEFPEEPQNVTLRTKYRPRTGPSSTNPFAETVFATPNSLSSTSSESQNNLPSSPFQDEEKVSPMINSVRQVRSF
jgi:hypothetical protein